MDMVFHAAHDHRRAVEAVEGAAEVTVHFVAEGAVAQERAAFLGGENDMEQNLGEGLGHGPKMARRAGRFNSFRVDEKWYREHPG